MKFSANKEDLIPCLTRCAEASERRGIVPILGNVKIVVDGVGALFSASDLVLSFTEALDVDGAENGSLLVNARDLLSRVKAMPGGVVKFEERDGVLKIHGGGLSFKLSTMSAEDFPELPQAPDDPFLIPGSLLASLLGFVSPSVSGDISRVHLNSVLLESDESGFRAVATDGHRLSIIENAKLEREFKCLIPSRCIGELSRFAGSLKEVSLSLVGNNLFATDGPRLLSVKLADAAFPPYGQVIPESSKHSFVINRKHMTEICQAVLLASSGDTHGIKLVRSFEVLTLETESVDRGSSVGALAQYSKGNDFEVGLSGKYMLDALRSFSCDTLKVELSGDLDPVVISDDTKKVVIMPMRI